MVLGEAKALMKADVQALRLGEWALALGLERQTERDERALLGTKVWVGVLASAQLESDWILHSEWAAVPLPEVCCYALVNHGSMLPGAGWRRHQAGRD